MKNVFFFLLLTSLSSCFSQEVNDSTYHELLQDLLDHSVTEVSVHEVDASDTSIVFLDAREKYEYNVSHIQNATWVGYLTFSTKRVKRITKNKHIIVYCSVGYRSEKITEKLLKAGYTNVSNLYGGIFEWKNQGKLLVNKNGKKTDKVHAYDRRWGKWLRKGKKVF